MIEKIIIIGNLLLDFLDFRIPFFLERCILTPVISL